MAASFKPFHFLPETDYVPTHRDLSRLLAIIVEHLDIPQSYYDKAAARHHSLGEWLHRSESKLGHLGPDVRPQGSFRFGTVIRPLDENDEYDLDNVTVLKLLGKAGMTQQELKHLFGMEIKAYAAGHNMKSPPVEHNRAGASTTPMKCRSISTRCPVFPRKQQ